MSVAKISSFAYNLLARMKQKWPFYFAVFFLIFTLILVVKNIWQGQALIRPQAVFNTKPNLEKVVQTAFKDANGTYAVVIKNLKTEENYSLLPDQEFETGSLYKLWIMATAFKEIEEGNLKEDEVLSEDIDTLNRIFEIDPDLAELTEGSISLTVHDALNQMITISHNYAALLLTEKIKLSTVANFLNNNGFTKSSVGTGGDSPKSNALDIALFLEKLYKEELVSADASQKMIELLKKQQLNDGLPKYLPEGAHERSSVQQVTVAHKTGDVGWFKHDAGIVFTPFGNYIIVIMSQSDNPAGAQERIALVSKAVYDYFSGNI